ncbi:MAG TPA: 50S ribosomal protein L23 [Candidatus Woesearchaeota archaeon]|nr:MAG: 50S ribosomal protein L23 [Candidatus Woesearchaeota archaeon]HDD70641.1 50S ribosomal protein L23 [Candidatus Woesearchaeota archaeon]
MDPYNIIKYPLSTEKAIKLMESENKLVFVVDFKAKKKDIKDAVENLFDVKVLKVNTVISNGQKRAYVKFPADRPAIDIATNMGIM